MKLVGGIPPTNPFHVARAYGVARVAQATPGPTLSAPDATTRTPGAAIPPDVAARVARLVGSVVPGHVDFGGEQPAVGSGFSLYRRPADRNAAATGVELGRKIDVTG